jgi:hypothetical protein
MTNSKDVGNLINITSLILDAVGKKLTKEEKELLLSRKTPEQFKQMNDEQKKKIGTVALKMIEGYLTLAVKGYKFTEIDKIKENFGKTVEKNYPEASKSFIKFAETYWTFNLCLRSFISEKLVNYVAYSLLFDLEHRVASIFFPTPGPITIPSNERERTQREILKDFDIDIEDFIKGNPILIRDRKAGM